MKLTRDYVYKNCIQKVKVEFGTLLGCETEEEAYVILRELPTLETMELNEAHEKGEVELLKYFKKVLPNILIDHNFYETEDKKMSNEDVINFIFEKLDISSKIIGDYTEKVFHSHQNQTN